MATQIKATSYSSTIGPIAAALVCFLYLTMGVNTALMQAKSPYDKDRILKVVRLNALSTQEIVQAIQQRGVTFQTTPAVEAEFKEAGARPEVIDAVRANYRPAAGGTSGSGAPAGGTPPGGKSPAGSSPGSGTSNRVPPGPPLAKNEIITLLQSGVASARVEQFVEVRGVSFAMNPEIAREITAAGGNRSLVGAITEKATSGAAPGTNNGRGIPPRKTGPDYDELTDQAISAMQANNSNYAIRLLQQAVTTDASRPTAYQLLGYAELYGSKDILSAERAMRAAVERGGSAVFYVYHDHDGFFRTFCEGSLFVTKANVTYKAKDGNHTFETDSSKIREAKLNGMVGSQYGAFHIKVVQGEGDKTKTFNFAPATRQKSESNLVLSFIQSH